MCVVKYLCPTCCHQHGFQAIPTNVTVVDGGDAPLELIPTLAEKPAESVNAATPAVKPVSRYDAARSAASVTPLTRLCVSHRARSAERTPGRSVGLASLFAWR